MTYTQENSSKACHSITDEEFEDLRKIDDFRGSEDLPDGVEFCHALTIEGERVRIYRGSNPGLSPRPQGGSDLGR